MTQRSRSTASLATSARLWGENTAPVGLPGLSSTIRRVRGVTARRSASGSTSKPLDSCVITGTGTPPSNRTCSGYETQYGLGSSKSSPGFTRAITILWNVGLAPQETVTSSSAYSRPLSRLSFWQTAARSSGMPPTSVYLVWPFSSARTAASLIRRGVSKSGSPAPKEITSMPCARRARALACMASVGEGASVFIRSASMGLLACGLAVSRKFLGEPLLDRRGHHAGARRAQRGHLFDEARGDVGVPLVRHHEHGLHGVAELAVHEGHLELVLEVGHRAQAAHHAVGALALDQIDQEPVERRDAHPAHPDARRALVDQLQALLRAEQGLLGGIGHHRDDQLVEDAQAALDEVQVSVVHRIEHARIDRSLAHAGLHAIAKCPKTLPSLRGAPEDSQGGLPEAARLPERERADGGDRRRLGAVLEHAPRAVEQRRPRRHRLERGRRARRVVRRVEEDHREARA